MSKILQVSFIAAALFVSQAVVANSEGEELFKSGGLACAACHSVDTKMVGPSFKEIAAKNDGVEGAAATLAKNIKEGSQGMWGPVPMPPNAVSEEQATSLAEWILSLK